MDGRSNRSAYSNQLPPPSAPLPPGRIAVNKLETDGIEHMRLGELAEAERDLMAALKQREAIYSDDAEHPQLACALNNLAVLHLKQHRLEEAAAGFERVVRIKELVQRHTPSSRTLLEITAARNNLDAVRRFQAREAPPLHSTVLPPQCAGPLAAASSGVVSGGAGASAGSVGWAQQREMRGGGSDSLRSTQLKHKERIAQSLGVPVAGKTEAEVDEAIRRSVRGDVDTEALKILVNLAFDLLDVNGNGQLSKVDVLTGMKEKPQVQEMLSMGPFADPAAFLDVVHAIDADGSGALNRADFARYFLRKLVPHEPAPETAAERQQRLVVGGGFQFRDAGRLYRERERGLDGGGAGAAASLSASLERPASRGGLGADALSAGAVGLAFEPSSFRQGVSAGGGGGAQHGGGALTNPERADLGFYDDVMRGLETAFRRRLGLQQDIGAMQRELHLVEADIATKSASADRVRQALSGHSKSHTQLAGALDDQIRRLDERARLAQRPDLATGARPDRLR